MRKYLAAFGVFFGFMLALPWIPGVAHADTSLEVGPGRQVLKVNHPVQVYAGDFYGSAFKVTTHFAYFDTNTMSFVEDNNLPLTVTPDHFTIHHGQQITTTVNLTDGVPYPMVAVAYEFTPSHLEGTGIAVKAMLYGELTTHPKAPIFTPPLTPTPAHSSLYWLPYGLLLLAILGVGDYVRRKLKNRRPRKPVKAMGFGT